MDYKRPESVLVVIYAATSKRVLMLQRRDDPEFWQSVTGSLEGNEQPWEAALREVQEEIGIDIVNAGFELTDCQRCLYYEIFSHLRYRYAPGVTRNKEHWFLLALPEEREILLTEHLAYQWLAVEEAAGLTKSWSNRQAIEEFVI
ncbi:dihydroneopterin triphosphate diphosphatase [Xenorhabdus bovienii]|uniref:dATP pyrophosphohydrolase, MutT-like n=1 Tax=Xenorhabdus bovienii str. Intermedium TaxID=1379677 RepID=A0A077QCI3_XENBV|nr:dihydroneopterin triphosphate diphosphatase [Xenorhabdus bovienii]MDE9455247.1 dihydroneopterin triphosphate diphosphatase [Xenorhabdus bovienii]MDE9481011.1 dihydroneopterin triphosphate diphosphatase [Xenorhabdus bovienii]MDE9543922.1 dihydroneopterin triphosphate diphosphatase [Xenorhabdus bovienii]MDE9556685.1 dihydroneopterin triphosphate diphosphatase [Xenorhabdus bovienii]MDE9564829.1 dihydroneopterin triphosphate diphosphatase [Xenorhabdus bovienii]